MKNKLNIVLTGVVTTILVFACWLQLLTPPVENHETLALSCPESPGATYEVLGEAPESIHCDPFQGSTITLHDATIWLMFRVANGNIEWYEGEISMGFEEIPLECSLATDTGISLQEIDPTGSIPLGDAKFAGMTCNGNERVVRVNWTQQ